MADKVPIESLDPKKFILIKNASVNNLKHIDVAIPRNKFVVVTGVSGSGKSSLAFDTLYAEGQRRYVESLSSYARQFMGKMEKPAVDYIKGIAPAIAIEQKVNTRNPRSTVGTSTEIYDYLKLLFARVGKTVSPVSGNVVKKHSISHVVDFVNSHDDGTRFMILAPLQWHPKRDELEEMKILLQKGFSRVEIDGEIKSIEDFYKVSEGVLKQVQDDGEEESVETKPKKKKKTKKELAAEAAAAPVPVSKKRTHAQHEIRILIDRISVNKNDDDANSRLSDSIQIAFNEGNGYCFVYEVKDDSVIKSQFTNRFEADGITFEEPTTNLFSFNNPYGACKRCEGFGNVVGIDPDLVVPDKSLSIYDGAILCWRGEKMNEWNKRLIMNAYKFDFPIHKPFHDLTEEQRRLLWTGNQYFFGLDAFFKHVEEQVYKIQYRVMLSRYRGKTVCPDCRGSRLRADANYVKIGNKSITDIVLMPVDQSLVFFQDIQFEEHEQLIAKRLLLEIRNRLKFLNDVGLGYLTMNRLSNTLSGGESQRINLATSLGSSLVGSMYILDEPSIGLHPRDTERLIVVLKSLRNLGNTLIIVEHDEEIMRAADELIDIGPEAGIHGGNISFQGNFETMMRDSNSLTAKFLSGEEKINVPLERRKWKEFIEVKGARENNLKNIDVKFPLHVMTVVTGVSGSGKTSLVKKILYPSLKKISGGYHDITGNYDHLAGSYNQLSVVEMIDQNPIGKSSRSNPVTFVKAYDEIRALFADLPFSAMRKYMPSHFSFNVAGGRCDLCQGEGFVTIEMQFMADIHLTCESCHGKRFKEEVLEVHYKEKNISDILDMTVDESLDFFDGSNTTEKFKSYEQRIFNRIVALRDVGMGYVKLGQSSNTLSGGEAQRIKLASYLIKGQAASNTLFIFDEPTTGLHFHDINKLLNAFNALIENGNSIIIIEHNPEVIKCADWIIDLGPEGGESGGYVVFEGLPEDLINCQQSHTGRYIKEKLK